MPWSQPLYPRTYTPAELAERDRATLRSYALGTTPPQFIETPAGTPGRFDPNRFGGHAVPSYPIYDILSRSYVDPLGNSYTGELPGGLWATGGKVTPRPAQADAAPAGVPVGPDGKPADAPKLITYDEQPAVTAYSEAALKALPGQSAQTQSAFEKAKAEADAARMEARKNAGRAYDTSKTEREIKGYLEDQDVAGAKTIARMEENLEANKARQDALIAQDRARAAQYAAQLATTAGAAYGLNFRRGVAAPEIGSALNSTAGAAPGLASGAARGNRARVYTETMIPLQRELFGIDMGITGQERANQAGFFASEQDQSRFNLAVAERAAAMGISAAQYLADLNARMQGMNTDEMLRFLAIDMQLPGLEQELRAREIDMAARLAALNRSSQQFEYYQPFDPSRIPPTAETYYPVSAPTRSYTNPTSPGALPPTVTGGAGGSRSYGAGWSDAEILSNPALDWERYQKLRVAAQYPNALPPGRKNYNRAYALQQVSGAANSPYLAEMERTRRLYE